MIGGTRRTLSIRGHIPSILAFQRVYTLVRVLQLRVPMLSLLGSKSKAAWKTGVPGVWRLSSEVRKSESARSVLCSGWPALGTGR